MLSAKLSILTFPQQWENNQLTIRVLVMPRNFNPLIPDQVAPGTPAWVDAKMALIAKLVTDPSVYPSIKATSQNFALTGIAMPADTKPIFEDMRDQLGPINSVKRQEAAKPGDRARKYLPESYRNSFNFTQPRTPDASIDDSYHCIIKDNTPFAGTFGTVHDLSWGKVFAHCLRQPALAERVGFIYEASFAVDPQQVKNGSWIYVDLADECSYKAAMDQTTIPDPAKGQKLVKRYAAKLPKLKAGENRSLFAAIQFPVLIKNPEPGDTLNEDIPIAASNFDELLIETEQYDDGFCKIVHANQPVSSDLLREKEDKELPVITDAGIRLAWDDEQLLMWMNRQIKQDETLALGRRTDAPMGVMQYRVDVRWHSDEAVNPNPWVPLCQVQNKGDLMIGGQQIDALGNSRELGVEVYPAKPRPGESYWLPQYYSHWIGKSLVLADNDAIDIYRKQDNEIAEKQANKYEMYDAAGIGDMKLLYGNKYDFRVRLADISGGGPGIDQQRRYASPSPEAYCDFRRMVQPQAVRLQNKLPLKDDEFFTDAELVMKRPLLGYPSVLFTGAYPNAVTDLITDTTKAIKGKRPVGLPDPNVEAVEVLVEIKALEMDMLLRYDTDSHESYAKLYVTKRLFPAEDLNGECHIPITYVDAPVLNFTDSQDLGTLGLIAGGTSIDDHNDIVLPTSRDIRITLRPVVKNLPEYYAKNSNLPRKGKPIAFRTRKAATDEQQLFKDIADVDAIRGIWLQPDTDTYLKATLTEMFVENNSPTHASSMIERLTEAIDKTIEVKSKGLSLVGKKGCRIQFGASRLIRHNLSPDSTSITISTKSDLLNQWIVPITLLLNRDWTWDGASPVSFQIYRKTKFVGAGIASEIQNAISWGAEKLVGDIEMKQTINIQALYTPDRSQTYLCFLDAIEPKPKTAVGFPEEIMASYRIQPVFRNIPDTIDAESADGKTLQIHLPITGKPADLPEIVSAGIAQSKYISDEIYSSTEPRKRYLWIEFKEPLKNKSDAMYVRTLAYSPDPLLSKWDADMLKAPEEAPLPINPEPIRLISPLHTDDRSGLDAMQEMTKADISDVHYLVPLPPGLHASSPELFGFFTYEVRAGHKKGWSTAQGRFGRPLRTTGVQHPPPQLFCIVTRNEKHIIVTAPFAQTVYNGANVTSDPPRTQLWALLYAQVKRADDQVYRNILLDDQLFVRQRKKVNAAGLTIVDINTDAVQYGITGWKNKDVGLILSGYGLPADSPLSVLVVEMLPTYDKFFARSPGSNIRTGVAQPAAFKRSAAGLDIFNPQEGMNVEYFKNSIRATSEAAAEKQRELERLRYLQMEEGYIDQANKEENVRPLTDQLGSERILRTSTLVAVPEVCCIE